MKVLRWLDEHFEEAVMMLLLCVMAAVMTVQVFVRYVLSSPFPWAEEFCRYCQVWSTFISIGYCTKRGIMLQVDMLNKALPATLRWVVDMLIKLIVLAVYGFFFYQSFDFIRLAYRSTQVSAALGVPMYIVYSITTLGFFLGILRQLQDLYKHLRSRTAKTVEEGA